MSTTPNELEFLIRYHWNRHKGRIVLVVPVILAIWIVSSVFYSIEADSQGVILRLGKYSRIGEPGLHTKLPYPIETVMSVPVQKIQTLEFGFATTAAGRVTQYARPTAEHKIIGRMLTGDLNLAFVEWIVQYRISDPKDYLFRIGGGRTSELGVRDLIGDVSEVAMRKLVGDASVDEVITVGRDRIASAAKLELQKMLDKFEPGIEIVTVKLQSATPPEPVKDAFDSVNRARQNKDRVVNDALATKNRQIPAARGNRERVILEAEGYKQLVVLEMTGRANAFLAQLAEFEKVPEVTRTRLYLETMEEVLGQVDSKMVIDESIRGLLPLLNLNAVGETPPLSRRKGGAQ